MTYLQASSLLPGDVIVTHETIDSVVYPVEGDKVEVVMTDGNRVLWNSTSMVEVRARAATEDDERALREAYGMTSDELADEAERGYDVS